MTETFASVLQQWEEWTANPSPDKDIRPLSKAAAAHLTSKKAQIPEIAPCLAVLWHRSMDYESRLGPRIILRVMVWLGRAVFFRGRPMWNDFYMGLWALSRDSFYVEKLHAHLKTANSQQVYSGEWMIHSVCQQDPEFAEHWRFAIAKSGEVFSSGGKIACPI